MDPQPAPDNMISHPIVPIGTPFVLLDDASGNHSKVQDARLYCAPHGIIRADNRAELDSALAALDAARIRQPENTPNGANAGPYHLAGYLGYEAGLALEPRLHQRLEAYVDAKPHDAPPLCWFGKFADYDLIPADDVDGWLARQSHDMAHTPRPGIFTAQEDAGLYDTQFADIIAAIKSGDIYQANLTIRAHAHFNGCPIALYRHLRTRGAAKYSALVFDGTHWMLSLSPELFFASQNGRITTRPMKGTLPANPDNPNDCAAARHYFAHDEKNRAENLMIVDLLRNDLSRICAAGSVVTKDLFAVEHYPTVHQMVSTISGTMQKNIQPSDIIRALFPCGSITGAPKIRAMELIDESESAPRGIYCGTIGRIDAAAKSAIHDDANGPEPVSAAFNVAIRTLHFSPQSQRLILGLGSGVVADSQRENEWRECLDKGAFAMTASQQVDLIETMALYPDSGIIRLEAHLARMKESARQLAYEFDRHAARNAIQAACFHAVSPAKVRLLVSRSGNFAIQSSPLNDLGAVPLRAILADMPVAADDPRLAHNTTDRSFYDDARRSAADQHDAAEIIFLDNEGYATEGSFTHIFVRAPDAVSEQMDSEKAHYFTPPLSRGLLPGILRAEMIENASAIEHDLTRQDLITASQEQRLFLGNSVRGLFAAAVD